MSKTILRIGIALILSIGAFSVSAQTTTPPPSPGDDPPKQQPIQDFIKDYRIGPGDLLEIKVFELDQLNQTVRVSEDGSISLPLLGSVRVEGLTQGETETRLATLLQEKWVKNPQVSVFIKEYKSKQVAVIGAVQKPGNYELIGRKTLLQVVSMAGGFTDKTTNQLFVLRDGTNGDGDSIAIDLKDLLVNGNKELNIPIEPNDVVNVPIDREIRVFVMGRVTRPGEQRFKISERTTLLQAIAAAGGTAEGAREGGVTITRKDAKGKERKIKVDLNDIIRGKKPDIPLEEGDVVYVPESFW